MTPTSDAAGIGDDRKGPLFRSAIGKTGELSGRPVTRSDVWRMVRRRAADAGIETAIGCHTFRATGITDYLARDGKLENCTADGRTLERKDHRALRSARG